MRDRKNNNQYTSGNFTVRINKGESSESLIKRHIRKLKKEKLLDELFERSFYKKPSVKRRESDAKSEAIIRSARKKQSEELERDE
jgi:ribosomal protein S21